MKKLTIAALACAMPLTASAGGFGFTSHSGTSYVHGAEYQGSSVGELPSLDIRRSGWIIQIDAMELVYGLTREAGDSRELHVGLNTYKTVSRLDVRDHIGGVLQPGLSVDVDNVGDSMDYDVQLQMRMGARSQTPGGMGVGLYLVPGLGVASVGGETGLAVSGGMQIGIWRNSGD